MKVGAVWFGIGALAAFCWATTLEAGPKCVLRQVGELDVPLGEGVGTVEAAINGQPVRMIVDSGSFATSLFRSTPEKLGIPVKLIDGAVVYGIGGSQQMGEAGIKEFKVGPMVARGINLAVIDGAHGADVGGVLGIQFLRQMDIEFDYPDGKLRFFKPEGCLGDQVVYWGKAYSVADIRSNDAEGTVQVDVKLAGQSTLALMDSGFSESVVTPVLAKRLSSGGASTTELGQYQGIGRAKLDASVATFDSFSFGDETIHNAKLGVADLWHNDREVKLGSRIARSAVDEPEIILGADFLRSHRVYISKSQNKVYVSYSGGPVFVTHRSAEATARTPLPPRP